MPISPQPEIELRARRISDPLERLKFLQSAMDMPQPELPVGAAQPKFVWRKWSAIAALLLFLMMLIPAHTLSNSQPHPRSGAAQIDPFKSSVQQPVPDVWQVDRTAEFETYSNGLRIETRYTVPNEPREAYPVFDRKSSSSSPVRFASAPIGIVFHTTESNLAPFQADQNRTLQRFATAVVNFIQRNRSYHYVVDRFGRVFRVVVESDIANHAGKSVWADGDDVMVSLNQSFLGVAFETQTARGQLHPIATPAQIHSARVLTQMLRSKYRIPARNCVTHAQVSVNGSNYKIGYHTDWAGNFPFAEVGLDDNYQQPLGSVLAFGFGYDDAFLRSTGDRAWPGLLAAEDQLERQAQSRHLSLTQYRTALQHRYKELTAALKSAQKDEIDEN